ncbi:deoxynucleoside triphosphate triphosphohydrolase SAMHD1-like [Littorina saxatilis]|uniref:deoxynucleoside triphosphate triphosphohydrolase SAMHD1-like n=1 Tax=Littorina saxatilis TaxID=31220 RepID=UPI0038B4420F
MASRSKKRARQEPQAPEGELSNDVDMFAEDESPLPFQNGDEILASQPCQEQWQQWTVEDVAEKLRAIGIPVDTVCKFEEHKIDGSVLNRLTQEHMEDTLKIHELGTKLKIQAFLSELGFEDFDNLHPDGSKVFNDPIHGHMEFHPLFIAIIDTPQFQRLRYLKQLGACYFVYPGAAHNRFEHCLGVCHLAGELVSALRKRQPRLGITDTDILCVQIAGLCHDLGHGPFSHVFDNKFIPYARPDSKWQHEDASVDMFKHMVEVNGLEPVFEEYGLTQKDRVFIIEQIAGKPYTKCEEGGESTWRYGQEKAFLYEVVANKRNGVDVDKWDYFKRDCHHLAITSSFDHMRFIQFARVIRVDGELQICVRDKEAFNMYQMFHTRHALHRRAYQHKVVQAVEIMLVEAMKEVEESEDPYLMIPGDNGKRYKISDCINHMDAYTNLTDDIVHRILLSEPTDHHIMRAKEILQNIHKRKLYKCVGESVPITDADTIEKQGDKIKEEILQELSGQEAEVEKLQLNTTRFVVQVANLDFGKKYQNPVNDLRFFSKNNLNKAVAVNPTQISYMLPQVRFKEQLVRLFLRPTEDKETDRQCMRLLEKGFKDWCVKNTMKKPEELANIVATPRISTSAPACDNVTPTRAPRAPQSDTSAMKGRQRLSF